MSSSPVLDCLALKDVVRAGWVRAGVPHPESVADHSWAVSLLVLLTLPPELDRERALTYAVLHDLAEAWVGDITPVDGIAPEVKHGRELAAMQALTTRLGRSDLLDLWCAYEAQADPEARFVKQLDRLDMGLQAARYETQHGLDLSEFSRSARAGVPDPALLALLPPTPGAS